MQEARSFCDGGGSGPSGSLSLSSQPFLPSRPSFSLHLYDRFVRDSEISDPSACYPVNHNNPMDMDVDDAVVTSGIPPSADDAIALPVSLSSSQGITTPCISTSSLKGKNSTKRELLDDSHSAILVKKPASMESSSPNTSVARDHVKGDTSAVSSLPREPMARTYRYNNKDQLPFVVLVPRRIRVLLTRFISVGCSRRFFHEISSK